MSFIEEFNNMIGTKSSVTYGDLVDNNKTTSEKLSKVLDREDYKAYEQMKRADKNRLYEVSGNNRQEQQTDFTGKPQKYVQGIGMVTQMM